MSRIGLKYISSTGPGFPAVNPGKWNLASNFRNDLGKVLSDSGIEDDDFLSVAVFLCFTSQGRFICAARREDSLQWTGLAYEALWMFIPSSADISIEEFAHSIGELVEIFDHKEAFSSPEAFTDSLPSIFLKDFPEIEGKEISGRMGGSRIGFLTYENFEELKIILSGGFKPQYENFGLLLLTDNPVKVEASLPRIVLPELILAKEMKSITGEGTKENNEDEVVGSEAGMDEEAFIPNETEEILGQDEVKEKESEKEVATEEEEIENLKEEEITEEVADDEANDIYPISASSIEDLNTSAEYKNLNESKELPRRFSLVSFLLGMAFATLLFFIYMILTK